MTVHFVSWQTSGPLHKVCPLVDYIYNPTKLKGAKGLKNYLWFAEASASTKNFDTGVSHTSSRLFSKILTSLNFVIPGSSMRQHVDLRPPRTPIFGVRCLSRCRKIEHMGMALPQCRELDTYMSNFESEARRAKALYKYLKNYNVDRRKRSQDL